MSMQICSASSLVLDLPEARANKSSVRGGSRQISTRHVPSCSQEKTSRSTSKNKFDSRAPRLKRVSSR